MHGAPEVVLQPENLAMAFGLDVLNRNGDPKLGPGAGQRNNETGS
jgi:manganese transport system ATP-binding protein